MARDRTTHGNKVKGRIKGSEKLVSLGQEKVLLKKGITTNVNQLCDQRWNMKFNNSKHYVTNKGKILL